MSTEANKAVVRGWISDVLNGHDINAIDRYFAPDCVHYDAEMGDSQGTEAEKQQLATFVSGFPDLHFTVNLMLAEGDLVAGRATYSGTQTGDLMGIPPTGKRFETTVMSIFRLVDGKIVERWDNSDLMSQLHQLGIIPAQAPA
ncbi:MAG TPA: ester cyclase [Nitrolancea sp.]|jgi:steroid delta-isomerase-like uncharacterized protein|nr:ester cyclase [Nitrolancea sp.]